MLVACSYCCLCRVGWVWCTHYDIAVSVKAENIKGRAVGRERYATAREVDNDTGRGQAEKSKTKFKREREPRMHTKLLCLGRAPSSRGFAV